MARPSNQPLERLAPAGREFLETSNSSKSNGHYLSTPHSDQAGAWCSVASPCILSLSICNLEIGQRKRMFLQNHIFPLYS